MSEKNRQRDRDLECDSDHDSVAKVDTDTIPDHNSHARARADDDNDDDATISIKSGPFASGVTSAKRSILRIFLDHLPNSIPEGLQPRRTIQEIGKVLGIRFEGVPVHIPPTYTLIIDKNGRKAKANSKTSSDCSIEAHSSQKYIASLFNISTCTPEGLRPRQDIDAIGTKVGLGLMKVGAVTNMDARPETSNSLEVSECTPTGLRPRPNIEEIGASLGLRVFRVMQGEAENKSNITEHSTEGLSVLDDSNGTYFTPEGLQQYPQQTAVDVSNKLGLLSDTSLQDICTSQDKTVKKTNVSYTSNRNVLSVSAKKNKSRPGRSVQAKVKLSQSKSVLFVENDNDDDGDDNDNSWHFFLGREGDQNAAVSQDLEKDYKDVKPKVVPDPSPARQRGVRVLPPHKRNPNWSGFTPSPINNTGNSKSLNDNNINQNVTESGSFSDESLENKFKDWSTNDGSSLYEQIRTPTRSHQRKNDESNTSYNSRDALFDDNIQSDALVLSKGVHVKYEYVSLNDDKSHGNNMSEDDPFVVNGTNNSWISNISHFTGSQIDQRLTPQEVSHLFETSALGSLRDSAIAQEGPDTPMRTTDSHRESKKAVVLKELTLESKYNISVTNYQRDG